jgi:hypothetical protein
VVDKHWQIEESAPPPLPLPLALIDDHHECRLEREQNASQRVTLLGESPSSKRGYGNIWNCDPFTCLILLPFKIEVWIYLLQSLVSDHDSCAICEGFVTWQMDKGVNTGQGKPKPEEEKTRV